MDSFLYLGFLLLLFVFDFIWGVFDLIFIWFVFRVDVVGCDRRCGIVCLVCLLFLIYVGFVIVVGSGLLGSGVWICGFGVVFWLGLIVFVCLGFLEFNELIWKIFVV